uniref:B-cell lymphoma/leukemia 10 n=1 Tax=Papio anubis TaxID=9555 RepID=A0A8I5N3G7_PAPAN
MRKLTWATYRRPAQAWLEETPIVGGATRKAPIGGGNRIGPRAGANRLPQRQGGLCQGTRRGAVPAPEPLREGRNTPPSSASRRVGLRRRRPQGRGRKRYVLTPRVPLFPKGRLSFSRPALPPLLLPHYPETEAPSQGGAAQLELPDPEEAPSPASTMEPTAPSLTEEDLTEVKKDALENLRVYLCEKIIAERHFDHLRAKKILSREDTEEISCRTSSRKRAGKLLDYLQENPKGLDTLVESIRREKTQNFLIQKITDEVLKLRNIKLEHLKGLKCSSCEPFPDGATNNLSRSNSSESNFSEKLRASTVMYHPEGESSTTPFFSTNSSLNLPVLEVGRTENTIFSSTTLPRPGDPGAPPLPPDLQLEEEGTCGNSNEILKIKSMI